MLLSYHNSPEIKAKYVQRMLDHIAADELVTGYGWENGKGCFIGCTLNNYDHKQFEIELGVPEWLARVLDALFEGVSRQRRESFKYTLELIPVGKQLDKIKAPFLIFILESTLDKFDHEKFPEVLKCVNNVIDLYKDNCTDLNQFVAAAAHAATAATWAADAAAHAATAAWAAAQAAADATPIAADAATWAADAAAQAAAARSATWVVARSDAACGAANATAWAAARIAELAARAADAAYDKFADKLIELIEACE